MLEITFLSIIQGITEFLPISSSAHLILISKYIGFNNENLTIDISLHLGSLLAVIFFFKKEIFNFIQNKSLFVKILIGSLPTMISGFLIIKLNLIDHLRNTNIIGLTTVLFGILLFISDKSNSHNNIDRDFNLKNAIYIGLFQILSLVPGVSRSGITITAARFLNFDRINSAKISFLLSIPTLIGVSSYGILRLIKLKNFTLTIESFWAVTLSFIVSFVILQIFIKFLKKFNYTVFVIYRILLGIIILFYVFR